MNETIPFGKHRNKHIAEVPTRYIEWALATVDWTRFPETKQLLQDELDARTRPDLKGKRRKVIDFEERRKGHIDEEAIYDHWFLCTLSCGHIETARAIKGGQCPATVTCRYC
jgi:hypothetical protein